MTGQDLLRSTLEVHAPNTDLMFYKQTEPKYNHPNGSPYLDKVNSLIVAYQKGYRYILYLDCSITAIRPLDDIWNHIKKYGHYLYKSGYNCAQTTNDRCLNNFGITRDTAEHFHEAATNVIGIDTESVTGMKLINELQMDHIPESIQGVKWPNEYQRLQESHDSRFAFHRQDQAVISIIAGKYNMHLDEGNNFVMRDENNNEINNNTIFKLKGGVGEK